MPTSAYEGKAWTNLCLDAINAVKPVTNVLDIGCGEGTYSNLFRSTIGRTWIGIEIFEPYIQKYELHLKYDHVHTTDVRKFDVQDGQWDVVFCGDVLEHMHRREALSLCESLLASGATVFVSVPIIPFPQGSVDGNDHEAHLDQWTHAEALSELPDVVAHQKGNVVGVYVLSRQAAVIEALRTYSGGDDTLKLALQSADARPWLILAHQYYEAQSWCDCYFAARKATSLPNDEPNRSYMYLSLACWNTDMKAEARRHAMTALMASPTDKLLQDNLRFML